MIRVETVLIMPSIEVQLDPDRSDAYDMLVRELCDTCHESIDPVNFRFTARDGQHSVLREVVVEISEQTFLLRPGDQLSLDPTVHPSRWLVNAAGPAPRIPEQTVSEQNERGEHQR